MCSLYLIQHHNYPKFETDRFLMAILRCHTCTHYLMFLILLDAAGSDLASLPASFLSTIN